MQLVLDSQEGALNGAEKFLKKGAVDVIEGVERQCRRLVRLADGCCLRSGRARRDDGRFSGIGRCDNSCGQKGRIDGGGECEAQVYEGAAAKVGGDGRWAEK